MQPVPLTLLFAGLCALMQSVLTTLVIIRRVQTGVKLLDGGDERLLRRIRAHGNFAECVPLALILLALLESRGTTPALLWALGVGLVLGRLIHAVGLLSGASSASRIIGMVLTLAVLSVSGALSIWTFVR